MRALQCHELGSLDDIAVGTVAAPVPGPGQARVRVEAAGVAFPDLLIAKGLYQFRPEPPFTLGGEFAGSVLEVNGGAGRFAPGDRVCGFVHTGAFAEEIVVDQRRLIPLPDAVPSDLAAGFILNYATACAGLRHAGALRAGETVLVLGAGGGVGSAAVDLARALGARVIAAASSDEKLAVARALGADHLVNYAREDLREALMGILGKGGLDLVIDPVGGTMSEAAFRRLGWGGRHVVLGFAAGEIPRLPLNLPLLKGASVRGISVGALDEREPEIFAGYMRELLDLLAAGKLAPAITERVPLGRAAEALRRLDSRAAAGKIIVIPHEAL